PYLFVHTDSSRSVTITQAAGSDASLGFLLSAAVPVLPVLLAFQIVTWWIWRRVPRDIGFY
ncbi:MAG: hypothetical protein ACRD0P_35350, partial [Stackebrandtia sp.]